MTRLTQADWHLGSRDRWAASSLPDTAGSTAEHRCRDGASMAAANRSLPFRLMSDTPTLYEWAGGGSAIRRLIDAFYDRVERDDLLSVLFPGGVGEEHRANVVLWWSEVLGGPADYTDQLGGYSRMLAHHRDLRITPEQRFRFAATMSRAADDAALPDDPEFRRGVCQLRRMGNPPRHAQLAAERRCRRACASTSLGLGRGTPVHAESAEVAAP